MTLPRPARYIARVFLGVSILLACLVGWTWWSGNLGVVIPGQVYRSGQLSGSQIGDQIQRLGIHSVINLRGPNLDQGWYAAERRATLGAHAAHIDVPMASDMWLSRDQIRTIVQLLDQADRPCLIHCEWGAERTGLVSAFAILLQPGGTLEEARSQFTLRHLFVPTRDGRMMRGHLGAYQSWLRKNGLSHDSSNFRRWALEEYRPGSPSREEWPYDPYPLFVITKPAESSPVLAGRKADVTQSR